MEKVSSWRTPDMKHLTLNSIRRWDPYDHLSIFFTIFIILMALVYGDTLSLPPSFLRYSSYSLLDTAKI